MKPVKYHEINQSSLFRVRSRKRLAEILKTSTIDVDLILLDEKRYRENLIETRKPNGTIKIREVQVPRTRLRAIHERVKRLLSSIEPPSFLFCPVKRRSYVGNARAHIEGKEIRTLDVKDYFTSTPSRRVYWFFNTVLECEPDVASMLAELLTVDGHVPTGSPVSPILCFYAFFDMWHEIAELALANGCKITVYMDDLTISGPVVPEWLVWKIRKQIYGHGLRYHKERHFVEGFAEVTGVVLRQGRAFVPNRQRKKTHDLVRQVDSLPLGEERSRLARKLAGLKAQRRQVEAGRQ